MTDAEFAALSRLRASHTGRQVAKYIEHRQSIVREAYEDNPADENRRLLLQAYKQVGAVLFTKDLMEVL